MTAGVAAAQARIAAIESRFAGMRPAERPQVTAFQQALSAATSDLLASRTSEAEPAAVQTARAVSLGRPVGLTPMASNGTGASPLSTEMGPAGPPAELESYGNGRIPTDALSPISQGSHRLWAPAATSFQHMAAAAAMEGVDLSVSDSYRSYDEQVDLAQRKGLYSQGGLAARPGTSNHGWGRSVDVDTSGGAVEWLRSNGARFGFHEDVRGEPWHWTYRPAA